MKKIRIIFYVLFCAYLSLNAQEPNEILSLVKENLSQIETLQGYLIQKVNLDLYAQEVRGNFYFKSPDKIRIDYLQPRKQTILWIEEKIFIKENGETIEVSTDTLKQPAFLGELSEKLAEEDLENEYDFLFLGKDSKGICQIEAKPIQENNISRIIFYIDENKKSIIQSEVYDKNYDFVQTIKYSRFLKSDGIWFPQKIETWTKLVDGEMKVDIEFSKIKINQKIDEEKFR